jgi:hypothetical protein
MAVYIPGPESVRQVGVARDPGQSRATAQDFGAGIGEALADFGETAAAIGAHFYQKRKAVEDDVLEQRDDLEFETGARKAYLNMQGQAGVDPDNFHARVGETVNALGSELDKKYANEGIRVSPEAQQRMQARRANVLQHYTLQAVTDGHNARVVDLGRTVETNLTQIGTNLAQDGNITAASEQADRALGSLSSLVEPAELEKARQNTNATLGQSVVSYLNTLQDEAVADKTNDGRNSYVVEGHSLIEHAVSKGWIDPADGADFKRQWEQNYQIRVIKSETDPQERLRMLGGVSRVRSGGAPSRETQAFLSSMAEGGATRSDSFSGLNGGFADSLAAMIESMPAEVREGFSIKSGYRSEEKQSELWAAALKKYGSADAARKWVAPPGRSQHNHGNAVDLGYGSSEARRWVHENAGRFGLTFPLGNEPWHIEAAGARGGGGGGRTIIQAMEQVESSGNPNAESPKGARGLMQVMPATAKEIAQELGDTNFPTTGDSDIAKYLSDPAVSRRYGAHYFNKMLDRYDGDQEAALIAYNAGPNGPHGADAWLAAGRDDSVLYQETAEYVDKVRAAMGGDEVIATSDVEVGAGDVVGTSDVDVPDASGSLFAPEDAEAGQPDSFFASMPEDVRQELIGGARHEIKAIEKAQHSYETEMEKEDRQEITKAGYDMMREDDIAEAEWRKADANASVTDWAPVAGGPWRSETPEKPPRQLNEEWLEANRDILNVSDYKAFSRAIAPDQVTKATPPKEYIRLLDMADNDPEEAIEEVRRQYGEGVISKDVFNKVLGRAEKNERSGSGRDYATEMRSYVSTQMTPDSDAPRSLYSRKLDALFSFDDWISANPDASREETRKQAQAVVDDFQKIRYASGVNSLPMPRFSMKTPETLDLPELEKAMAKTTGSLEKGMINTRQAAEQAAIIRRWMDIIQYRDE